MNIATYIEHSLLNPDATIADIEKGLVEATLYGFPAVCVSPLFIKTAVSKIDTSKMQLATVIGFPLGYSVIEAKVAEVIMSILDGTDAIMLSEETTLGEYPLEAVELMSRVAMRTENDLLHEQLLFSKERINPKSVTENMTAYAIRTAHKIDAKFVIALTNAGASARMMSRYRPQLPILVFTPNEKTYQKSLLSFGCWAFKIKSYTDFEHAVADIKETNLMNKLAKKSDKIVIVSGRPFSKPVGTNMMVVETI